MNRFERMFGILLHLRSGQPVTATDLAQRYGVSTRTIYRDVDTLSAMGVPVYAERGRSGGLRLLEGFYLPPLMFTEKEAISLLLGLQALRTLRVRPLLPEMGTAGEKLL